MDTVDLEAERGRVLANIAALEAAENCRDIEGILALATDDLTVVFPGTRIQGTAEVRAWLARAVTDLVSSDHIPIRIEVAPSGDMAWALALEVNRRQRPEGLVETRQHYLLTFRKVGGD